MTILVTGAGGMLGQDVIDEIARRGHAGIAADRAFLDVSDRAAVFTRLEEARPDAVIHCAAFTNVDGAESDPAGAYLGNAVTARHIADACAKLDAWMLHVSTDFVFDGEKGEAYDETDAVNPQSVYGASKEAGERLVRLSLPGRHMIARTSFLYGPGGKNIVKSIVKFARSRDSLTFVDDQIVSPTHTLDLARKLIDLAESPEAGTYHVASTGSCSLLEFARAAVAGAGLSTPVLPTTLEEFEARYNPPAKRPRISPLFAGALSRRGMADMPNWDDALSAYLSRPGSGVREE